jgi:uncharacterized protein (TIGR00255 family)
MIKSMTAFARKQNQGAWGSASVELKTVNHRYLDVNLRLPEMLRELEMPLRNLLRKSLQRGKVDVSIRFTQGSDVETEISLNQELINQLVKAAEQIESKMPSATPYTALDIMHWPGAMQVADADLSTTQKEIITLATAAAEELNNVREREGAAMAECITLRLEEIEKQIEIVKPRIKEVVAEQQKKLHERIADLEASVDEARIEQEVALLAQRLDVAEEIDRLTTHIKETRRIVKKGGPVGRRLDFLMQELNREANTIASKSIDTDMTQAAVEIKVLIEQVREQIQNIE